MIDLDTRMRNASTSLRRASGRLTPDGPPRSHARPTLLAMTAVVVLAVAVGAVGALRDGRGQAQVSTDHTIQQPDLPQLIPAELPDGLPAPEVVELATPLGISAAASMTVYGDRDTDDPLAETDLAVLVTEDDTAPDRGSMLSDALPVTVRGHQGRAMELDQLGWSVWWQEEPTTSVLVASHTLDLDQLLAVAEDLIVTQSSATLPAGAGDLAHSLTPLGTVVGSLARIWTGWLPIHELGPGYTVESSGSAGQLFVTTFAGDASDLAVLRWLTRAGTTTDVRGQRGWLASDSAIPNNHTLLWEESPGVIVMIQSNGFNISEVRAVATSLRPASDEEWAEMLTVPSIEDLVDGTD
jgi:hypothetical protein